MPRVLSVLAIIDTPTPASWINQLIARLDARNNVELSLVLQDSGSQSGRADEQLPDHAAELVDTVKPPSLAVRLANHLLLHRIDKPRFSHDPWKAEELVTAPSTRLLTADDIGPMLAQCDVVLKLTTAELPDSLWPTNAAPLWDAHLETLDARIEDALLQREPLTWVHLWSHQRSVDGNGQGTAGIHSHRIASHALPRQTFSLTDLRRAAWFSLATLIDSRLNWLANSRDPVSTEYSESLPLAGHIVDPEVRAAHVQGEQMQQNDFRPPRIAATRRLLRVLQLLACQSVERIRNRFWYEQWQLAFRNDGPDELFLPSSDKTGSDSLQSSERLNALVHGDVDEFLPIDSPDRTWWADPHLCRHGDSLYVFFEEMPIDARHAQLAVARLSDDGRVEEVETVMNGGQHLSYPFVFSDKDDFYMIPETASRRSVQLYKAQDFPRHWVKVKDLLSDVNLADSTVHFDGERWWMFSNGMSHRSVDERDELHLFHAESVTGPWQPHPLNPVVTGVDRARMAGSIIRDGSQLYRPSQFGALRYGHGINLHRIERLDLHSYVETTVGRLLPDSGSQWLGCHSTSYLDGITVIDRVIRRRR